MDDLFNATEEESNGKENVAVSTHYGIVNSNGTVSSEFLSKMRTEIALINNSTKASSLLKIPVEVLSRLVSILDQQIQMGASISMKASTVII